MNRLRKWWFRLRGYKRFEAKRGDVSFITGWAKMLPRDPNDPHVMYRGFTDDGRVLEVSGYMPIPKQDDHAQPQ